MRRGQKIIKIKCLYARMHVCVCVYVWVFYCSEIKWENPKRSKTSEELRHNDAPGRKNRRKERWQLWLPQSLSQCYRPRITLGWCFKGLTQKSLKHPWMADNVCEWQPQHLWTDTRAFNIRNTTGSSVDHGTSVCPDGKATGTQLQPTTAMTTGQLVVRCSHF